MITLKSFIDDQLASGSLFFTKALAMEKLSLSLGQFYQQVNRLHKKGSVRLLSRGFYVIVPAEYKNFGLIPTHWIVGPYFQYLQRNYYIGFLSAASFYGGTQQQPMAFQVIVDVAQRDIPLPKGSFMEFHFNKQLQTAKLTEIKTHTGLAKISTREQTIVDLIKFHKQSGYFNNVASVIRDMAEDVDKDALLNTLSDAVETTALQRLGYLFEFLENDDLCQVVEQAMKSRKIFPTVLRPDHKKTKGSLNKKWNVIINDELELEE